MEYIIRSCSGLKIEAKKGQTISVIDMEGGQVADFFCGGSGLKIRTSFFQRA